MSFIHRLLSVSLLVAGAALLSGCAASRSFLPIGLPNAHQFTNCSLVYSKHEPADIAKLRMLGEIIKNNPSMLDKVIPASSLMDIVGKNAPGIGTGLATAVTAINGDVSIASIVGSTIAGSLSALAAARSEDKNQSRIDVCMPDDSDVVMFKDAYTQMIVVKRANKELVDALAAMPQDSTPLQKAKNPNA